MINNKQFIQKLTLLTVVNKAQFNKDVTNFNNMKGRKERNVLFNDTLNTFNVQLYGIGYVVKDHGRKEMFYLTTHSTHFIYNYMA